MLNFEKLPTSKPGQSNVQDGTFEAVIFDAKPAISKNTGNEYLNVSFKIEGGFVNENYFDSDKPFLQWKLGQLLKACNVQLSGEGTLRDVAKVVKGKKVMVDVAVNDNGYGAIDYSGNHEGVFAIANIPTSNEAFTLDDDIVAAVDSDVEIDEDF